MTETHDPLTIVLLGPPVAWARAMGGKTRGLFTPGKQRLNTRSWHALASEKMIGRLPFDCPLYIDFQAEMPIPRSWSQKKQQAAIRCEILPIGRPDLSNLVKQFEDSCNGVIWRDDSLIVEYTTLRKIYTVQPKITVTIRSSGALVL